MSDPTVRRHARPDQFPPDSGQSVAVRGRRVAIRWSPGLIDFAGPTEIVELLVPAATEFDRCSTELTALEERLSLLEATARQDVALAFSIRTADKRHWPRLLSTLEQLAHLRLDFARLDAGFAAPTFECSPLGNKLFNTLQEKCRIEGRLEAFDHRLETLEDLYEGAVDRINDHRYWRDGHWLEILIIAILVFETILIGVEVYLNYLNLNSE